MDFVFGFLEYSDFSHVLSKGMFLEECVVVVRFYYGEVFIIDCSLFFFIGEILMCRVCVCFAWHIC